jgi:CubicO group peptidase (beta-lactamase class C family)
MWRGERMHLAATVLLFALVVAIPAAAGLAPLPRQPSGVPWPTEMWATGPLPAGTDEAALGVAMAEAFDGANPALGETRAVVVVSGGRIVLERYTAGYGPDMPLPSWSMAKSVTHALVGAAVLQGLVDLDAPMGSPHWPAGDRRAAIPWRQWLNMVDGQDYHELDARLPTGDDVAKMLFGPGRLDAARYAASLPLAHPPGTRWNYNSAGEILICDALTRAVVPAPASSADRRDDMLRWMHASLFDPIGMRSAQPEFDAAGLYLGSSFVYATARDFARFGLLYLRDGIWDGRRLLPPGWVDFARTPAPAANVDVYGAGWWINPQSGTGIPFPALIDTGPERDAFRAEGHDGQIILIVPSRDLIVVRLGLSNDWPALYDWMGRVVRVFPPTSPQPP